VWPGLEIADVQAGRSHHPWQYTGCPSHPARLTGGNAVALAKEVGAAKPMAAQGPGRDHQGMNQLMKRTGRPILRFMTDISSRMCAVVKVID
jgi:hypothetical protein